MRHSTIGLRLMVAAMTLLFVSTQAFALNWQLDGAMPVGLDGVGVVTHGGDAFVFGGYNGLPAGQVAESFFYSPGGETTSAAAMPASKANMAYVAHNGEFYSIGGYREYAGVWGRTTEVWSYNPGTDVWTVEASLDYERDGCRAVSLGDYVYVVGGHHEPSGELADVDRYDPITNSWTAMPSLSVARSNPGAATVDGKLYVMGGNYGGGFLASMEIYDPVSNTWSTGPSMPTARQAFTTAVLGNRIYAIGGQDTSDAYCNIVEYFDVDAGQWFVDEAFPIAAASMSATVIDNQIYVFGGMVLSEGGNHTVDSVYVSVPEPATMSLLALGGVALLKRRKA